MRGWWSLWVDPGPCPVDDTPHTACTPESLEGRGTVTVPLRRPRTLDQAVPSTPVTVSTKTYRRATHRKLVRGD